MSSLVTVQGNRKAEQLAGLPALARGFVGLLNRIDCGSLELITPEGGSLSFKGHKPGPDAVLEIRDWQACANILRSGDIGVAESYRDRLIDTPDLLNLLLLALANLDVLDKALHGSFFGTLAYRLRHWLNRNSKSGSRKNIHAHYDIGNPFYQLWLDRSMTYSSALFKHEQEDLEAAQARKYDRLLDLLDVGPGQHVLEIGCGWGALAERALARGCRVTGISLSKQQLVYAKSRFKPNDPVELLYKDYRDLDGKYDAIMSIEMLEAVGEQYWPQYFEKIRTCLKPGGKAALQTITIANERFDDYRRGTDFIQQYIFPGGMLPSPQRLETEVTRAGLIMHAPFFFGTDYALTLKRWRESYEQHLEQVRQQGFDEAFIRLWRFYYCYCEAGFLTRRTDVCQVLLESAES